MMPDNDTLAAELRTAIAAQQAGRIADAEVGYRRVLAAAPGHFDAQHLLGVIAIQRGAHGEAARLIAGALTSDPANPLYADAYNNLAIALRGMGRPGDALTAYQQVIALKPDHADAHFNLGNLYKDIENNEAALASYETAARLQPARAEAHYNRGVTLFALVRREEALAACREAYLLNPNLPFLFGMIVYLRALLADWEGLEADLAQLAQEISAGKPAIHPFYLIGLLDSPAQQLTCARTWMDFHFPGHARGHAAVPAPGAKLRVGYFSMDFRNHLVGFIAAEIFKLHDRAKLEIYAFSYGPDTHAEMRQRLTSAVDGFIDVRAKSNAEIAALARDMQIDVAVDLAGHTLGSRPGIFAARAAPVQIAYLGYAGTFGSPAMDYVIADRIVVPDVARTDYAEKIIALPQSFFPAMGGMPGSIEPSARAAWSLPETGFVYCCFNTATKVMPRMFACWMRILARVPGSVLWLASGTPPFNARLLRAAKHCGIAAERIVFAARVEKGDHIARHRIADLFLDTLPYNGHTTSCQALLIGLPVLTLQGEAFSARVSASLLQAAGLPELITTTWEDYENLAVALATEPGRVDGVKRKLAEQLASSTLTHPARYVRHLEEAFARAAARARDGLPPDHIEVC